MLMTSFQRSQYIKFGKQGVCVDSTHGTNQYDFKLTTLLVLDEFRAGQPVAWCLSTRETEEYMSKFFQLVKDTCGPVSPPWFMSDLAPQFFNAFAAVNECKPKQLWCSWHVEKAWREALQSRITGDKSVDRRDCVYRYIKIITGAKDEKEFDAASNAFLQWMDTDLQLKSFSEYYTKERLPCKENWAYYHRYGLGINTNMVVEAFHKIFKYNYLRGKLNRRVDTCLLNLIKFSRDKIFSRVRKFTKNAPTYRENTINDAHNRSKALSLEKVEEVDNGIYKVQGETKESWYSVVGNEKSCDSCILRCVDCGICSHTLSCTCPRFLLYGISCKHVHLVKRFIDNNLEDSIPTAHSTGAATKEYAKAQIKDSLQALSSTQQKNENQARDTKKMKVKIIDMMRAKETVITESDANYDNLRKLHRTILADIR